MLEGLQRRQARQPVCQSRGRRRCHHRRPWHLTSGYLAEARKIRDAERLKPGIIRMTLDEALSREGLDPANLPNRARWFPETIVCPLDQTPFLQTHPAA